jgi:ADP-heptose:LPS heptosyltransferase
MGAGPLHGRPLLFVSADTGPLHLAAASGVPCLGLFTQTDPARYGAWAPSTSIW